MTDKRIAFITGATSGIGEATARILTRASERFALARKRIVTPNRSERTSECGSLLSLLPPLFRPKASKPQ